MIEGEPYEEMARSVVMGNENNKFKRAIEAYLAECGPESQALDPERLRTYIENENDEETLKLLIGNKVAIRDLLMINDPPVMALDSEDEVFSEDDLRSSFDNMKARACGGTDPGVDKTGFMGMTSLQFFWQRMKAHILWLTACLVVAMVGLFRSNHVVQPFVANSIIELRPDDAVLRSAETFPTLGEDTLLDVQLPNRYRDFSEYRLVLHRQRDVIGTFDVKGPRKNLPLFVPGRYLKKTGTYRLEVFGQVDDKTSMLGQFALQVIEP